MDLELKQLFIPADLSLVDLCVLSDFAMLPYALPLYYFLLLKEWTQKHYYN